MTERIDVRTDLVTDADAVTRICSAQDIVKMEIKSSSMT